MLNLRHGIYLIIFSMPLYLWRFSILGIPVNFLELMIYSLFFIWIFGKIRENNLANSFCGLSCIYKNNLILFLGIILLFLGLIISTAFSSELRTSLGIFKGWFLNPFLFFIIFIDIIKKEEQLLVSLKSWLFSGIVVSLVGILYLLNNDITFDGRLKAFFLSPNHLAMYLAPVFLIIFNFLLFERKKSKLLNLIIIVIILVPLYFTYSYGAFLGIFAGVIYLIKKFFNNTMFVIPAEAGIQGLNQNIKVKKKNLYYMGFVVSLFLILASLSSNKINQITNSENRSSFHSRLMIWNTAGEIIKDNLLLGIGPGTFQKTYLSYSENFSEPYLEWAVPQPHNIFLAFYLQTGLIGLIGFVLILIWFFSRKDAAVLRLYNTDVSKEIYIINALMIYILIHGLVDTTYWKNDLALIFWIIIGLKFLSFPRSRESRI
ncbi:MAG: O-antigen ligase family protein [Candidatus Pacebacteria bacterium]|nr:O-antigen ligase family protein [Candidatus Paceibacterota bacterium]